MNKIFSSTTLLFLLLTALCFGQEQNLLHTLDSLKKNENYEAIIQYRKTIDNIPSKSPAKGSYQLALAKAYNNSNKEDSAFLYFKKALKSFTLHQQEERIAETNYEIYSLLDSQKNLESNKEMYLNNLIEYAQEHKSDKWLGAIANQKAISFHNAQEVDSAKHYYNKALSYFRDMDSTKIQIGILSNLAAIHGKVYKDQDSAIIITKAALKLLDQDPTGKKNLNYRFAFCNNLGNYYRRAENYPKALEYYRMAENMDLSKQAHKYYLTLYKNIDSTYVELNDFKNAHKYFSKSDSIEKVINLKDQNASITEVEARYENEKLRADNLEAEAARKRNRNLSILATVLLISVAIVSFLIQKNTRRKQKLAENEKELQTQKLATVLKEQELKAIDAMIEGQEKERLRIANDLHDDLGGLMANVKLHFNSLNGHQNQELFERTNTLIDEAYNKVRSIAHAKNSGVIAKQGLLKAVQQMADKISYANKISIEVIDHGLENRLENSLELTIFRIIQELTTNVIKHAEASEITIHLTNHDDSLNIMVEDNGKGFNPTKITSKSDGMGLGSIDKRVDHLHGSMAIESEPKKGTTIIIDIPL
ncbi:sensor histidine kinase [Mangrovimonas sp. TPBH4]|uniref:tetratricopeptide repeat-containing sensor histidine kinase n=1 Tax=Mangrovimonas sp. TPBH4 TaxID=1645914 RepID=UPI0006B635E7|nr:sensor histidine kinase [Mangrovimonas sp. TPBH4]